MSLIPEWMSNVHPLIVHFPVALLVIAVLADFLSLILKRYDCMCSEHWERWRLILPVNRRRTL